MDPVAVIRFEDLEPLAWIFVLLAEELCATRTFLLFFDGSLTNVDERMSSLACLYHFVDKTFEVIW